MQRSTRFVAALIALALSGAAGAMDTSRTDAAPKDPTLEQARAAIAKQDWAAAQGILREAVARTPNNADYQNLYAFSLRSEIGRAHV